MPNVPDDGVVRSADIDLTHEAAIPPKQPFIMVGTYRLLEKVGEGGMGEVWLAEQARPVHRQVALKLIKSGMDTAHVVARFDAERQALALMDHPAIARVFDGGTTPEGRPYFVMEFVRGESIAAYAIHHKLSLRDRIELFIQVCEGVQHAHQKGIIHRDLKPSNVLVTIRDDRAVPKIIDFGVAKAITQSLAGQTLHTEFGALVGTPEYMSPEQAEMSGLDVDTRTDVYALGVILYKLLTGTLPFDAKSLREKPLDEIRRTIREVDPSRPSTRVTKLPAARGDAPSPDTMRLARQLRGDLDWITMKALEKDRTRRYGSVSDLAADLRRHLDDQPTLASPPSIVYRVQKFVRRHWLGVAASVALAFTLAGGIAVSLYQARIAATRFQQVRKLANRFLFDFDDQIRTLPGSTAARQMIVATALEYLDSLSKDARNDPDLQWELAKAYERVGEVQGDPGRPSLGQTKAAHESYKKSAAMQQELVDRGFADRSRRESLSQAYTHVTATARLVGSPGEALAAAERSVEYARAVSDEAVANARISLMMVQLDRGEPLTSVATGQAIVSTLLPMSRADASWTKVRQALARTYLMIGRASHRAARFEQAAEAYQHAIQLRERRLAEPVLDTANARDLVLAYHGAGDVLGADDRFSLNRPRDAEVFYRKALDLAERLDSTDSKNATARMELVRSIGKWAGVVEEVQPAEALRQYRRALDLAESVLPEGLDRQALRGYAYGSIASAAARLGRRAEARENIEQSRSIWDARLAARPNSPGALSDVADVYLESAKLNLSDRDASIQLYRKSLAAADQAAALVPKDFAVAFREVGALEGLAAALGKQGPGDEVQALRQRLVELWTKWDAIQPGSSFILNKLREATDALAR
jgi:serine/threonine protein kinase/tetratricopeptide (TPR) repeat protein